MTNDVKYEIMKLGFDSKNQGYIRQSSIKFWNDVPTEVRLDGVKVFEMVRLGFDKKLVVDGEFTSEITVLVGYPAYAIHSFTPSRYQYSAFLRDVELSEYEHVGSMYGRNVLTGTLDHVIATPIRTTMIV